MMEKIGIVAGNGNMPAEVIERCKARGLRPFVIGLAPFVDVSKLGAGASGEALTEASGGVSDEISAGASGGQKLPTEASVRVLRLGQVGRMVDFLRSNGVHKVMMAGGSPRAEALREIRRHGLDFVALGMLFRLGWKLLTKGNAAVFKAVLAEADRLGLSIVGVQDVLPEMVVGEGVMTLAQPSEADLADIRVGIEAALDIGRRDIGQAVAVLDGVVLATEDSRGTDATLRRARDASAHDDKVRRPVMVKFPSPGQDLRVDFPALGTDTIEALARNGFAGVAFETGGALIIDRQAVIAAADRAGVFIIGLKI